MMLINSVKMQMTEMLRKRTVIFTYFVLLGFSMANFFVNMFHYREVQYVSQMFDPVKLLTLSDWSVSGYFLLEYFPLLVVIPTACAYLTDKDTQVKIYLQSRVGSACYWYGKLITVFLSTFLIFTIPFFIELLLSCLCFDMSSMGDPSNFRYLQTIENENQYFLSSIWVNNRILYAVVMILLFGVIAGIFAVLNLSITTFRIFKYKILTFFPIYILFYLVSMMEAFSDKSYTMNYFFILRMFNTAPKNWTVYTLFLAGLTGIAVLIIQWRARKENSI